MVTARNQEKTAVFSGCGMVMIYYESSLLGPPIPTIYSTDNVNYIGIGMYNAWKGTSYDHAALKVKLWKSIMYFNTKTDNALRWMNEGYQLYYKIQSERTGVPLPGPTISPSR